MNVGNEETLVFETTPCLWEGERVVHLKEKVQELQTVNIASP